MWLPIIRAHISCHEWQEFLQWILTAHSGDYLDWETDLWEAPEMNLLRAPSGEAGAELSPDQLQMERQTEWLVEWLSHQGWHCLEGEHFRDTDLFPRLRVIDPFGEPHEPGDMVFVNADGLPETPGWPVSVSLLAHLLGGVPAEPTGTWPAGLSGPDHSAITDSPTR